MELIIVWREKRLPRRLVKRFPGNSGTGGNFTLDSTIGQSVAGVSSGSPFAASIGFWNFSPLSPTAASVTISGRVLVSPNGGGLTNAVVVMTDMNGNMRYARSSSFGYYRFEDVEVGQTYIFDVHSKRYQFAPQIVTVMEELTELNFTAEP